METIDDDGRCKKVGNRSSWPAIFNGQAATRKGHGGGGQSFIHRLDGGGQFQGEQSPYFFFSFLGTYYPPSRWKRKLPQGAGIQTQQERSVRIKGFLILSRTFVPPAEERLAF